MVNITAMVAQITAVSSLVKDISEKGQDIDLNDDQATQALLASARALVANLESPAERIAKISFQEPFVNMAIRVCIDLKLFEKMQEDGAGAKSAEQLAKMTGADPRLLGIANHVSG